MKKFIFILLLLPTLLLASDPSNTYQWNRTNALLKNKKTDTKPWYEWWYFKTINPKTNRAYFFVYGVVNPWDNNNTMKGTRSYVSFGDFSNKELFESTFDVKEFESSYEKTFVKVGENTMTDTKLEGTITDNGKTVSWNIDVKKVLSFNAMGIWTKIPGPINIYWYPAQASAVMNGTITIDGETIELKNAKAYQDRNWGNSFPKWWSWIVSNNFKNNPDTVLVSGGGLPKILGHEPVGGMSIGFYHKGKLYRFSPHLGDLQDYKITPDTWEVTATKVGRYKIEIKAHAEPSKFMLLPFVTPEGEVFKDFETLQGEVTVKLYKYNLLYNSYEFTEELYSDEAGIEWGSF